MMSKLGVIFFSLVLAILAVGCAKSACTDYCNACEPSTPDCVDLCVSNYEDEGNEDCTTAFRDFASCADKEGCGDNCTAEALEFGDECGWW
jgi:hypothetical protein